MVFPCVSLSQYIPFNPALFLRCSVKFDTQDRIAGQIHENVLVAAAKYVLENTAAALQFMLVPPLLKPLTWALLRAFPTKQLYQLNLARSQLYMAGICLAKNAMKRMGAQWVDELGMEKEFGECHVASEQLYSPCTHTRLQQPCTNHDWLQLHLYIAVLHACVALQAATAAVTGKLALHAKTSTIANSCVEGCQWLIWMSTRSFCITCCFARGCMSTAAKCAVTNLCSCVHPCSQDCCSSACDPAVSALHTSRGQRC